jgi:DNA-binding transcriptional regulator WhiA
VRHLIIKNFECKYSTSVLSYKKKQIEKQIKNEIKVNKKNLNLSLSPFPIFNSNKTITYLIIWDRAENTSFYTVKYLSHLERNIINITKYNRSILIGVMLSDGSMEKNKGWNPRIRIEQSIKYIQYVW